MTNILSDEYRKKIKVESKKNKMFNPTYQLLPQPTCMRMTEENAC